MMKSLFFRLIVIMFCASLVVMIGCASTAPSRFYVLNHIPSSGIQEQVEAHERCISLGIGPIEFPEYLDRPQIVTRVSQNELRLSEFDQWGEPLKNNFSHVLAENLSILLCTDNIDFFPWRRRNIPIDYQVAMEVTRLDGKLGENALLRARWTLLGGDGKKVLLKRQSSFSELTDTQDHEALVSAQSRALADLSREIAEAIKTLSR